MVSAYRLSQSIYVAAKLEIADQLAEGPRRAEEIAEAVGIDAEALRRLLHALSSAGVFAECRPGVFELTPVSEYLQTDSPESMHAWVIAMTGLPWQPWGLLLESLRTGRTAFESVYGMSRYQYFQRHPEEAAWFDRAMAGYRFPLSRMYDFSGCSTVVDLGGGLGECLGEILRAHPHLRGILVERSDVLEAARENLGARDLENRCQYLAGDLLEEVPRGGDVYILKAVLHNWGDEQALRILRNCRAAMSSASRLLVVESLSSGSGDDALAFLDLHMLLMYGGRERAAADMEKLLSKAELELRRSIPAGGVAVWEVAPPR